MKAQFLRMYPGPTGAHLSCLTKYSMTGERQTTGTMHPGGRRRPHKGYRMQRGEGDKLIPICGPQS